MSNFATNSYPNSRRKRALDLLGAACGIGLLFAAYPVIGLLIKLNSEGPIFYSKERVGKGGEIFKMVKFRTMRIGSDASKDMLRTKGTDDPRITGVGRVLRRTHLDELPQFLAVAKGDMSLVGPRPELPALIPDILEHEPRFNDRHSVKPGVTGIAQIEFIHASDSASAARRFQYDAEYLAKGSLRLDLSLIAKTVLTVIGRKGDK